jgi:hypothetical protein
MDEDKKVDFGGPCLGSEPGDGLNLSFSWFPSVSLDKRRKSISDHSDLSLQRPIYSLLYYCPVTSQYIFVGKYIAEK